MDTHRRQRFTVSLWIISLLFLFLSTFGPTSSGQQPAAADLPTLVKELKHKDAKRRAEGVRRLTGLGEAANRPSPLWSKPSMTQTPRFAIALSLHSAAYGLEMKAARKSRPPSRLSSNCWATTTSTPASGPFSRYAGSGLAHAMHFPHCKQSGATGTTRSG